MKLYEGSGWLNTRIIRLKVKIASFIDYIYRPSRSATLRSLSAIPVIPGIDRLTRAEQTIVASVDSTCARTFVGACESRNKAFDRACTEGRKRKSRAIENGIHTLFAARIVHAERARNFRASIEKKPGFIKRVFENLPVNDQALRKKENKLLRLTLVPFKEDDIPTKIAPLTY